MDPYDENPRRKATPAHLELSPKRARTQCPTPHQAVNTGSTCTGLPLTSRSSFFKRASAQILRRVLHSSPA